MSALAERIIAARDAAKRHRDKALLDVMADAANKIVEMEAALKPFADLGVGSGPDDEVDAAPYRILRGAIRNARKAVA